MESEKIKIFVGFITYGETTAKYLPYFLPSLVKAAQKCGMTYEIFAIDNTEVEDNKNSRFIKDNFREIKFEWAGGNTGFARAYNKMINKAAAAGAEYFLALNPDMILEADTITKLISTIKTDEKIAVVQPKILKWDFVANKKTKIIDSYGLVMDKKYRFFDRFQGEKDESHPSLKAEEVFGFTGAAALFRISALEDAAYIQDGRKEYFDELMFMYKEDCDLSLRLRLAGFKIVFAPEAAVYHDRTAATLGKSFWQTLKNRRNKSRRVREWSFLNQWIILLKFKKFSQEGICYYLKASFFIIFFEPYLLKEAMNLFKIRKEIKKKREGLVTRVGIQEIEKFIIGD